MCVLALNGRSAKNNQRITLAAGVGVWYFLAAGKLNFYPIMDKKCIDSKSWNEIIYPFPKFNGCTDIFWDG